MLSLRTISRSVPRTLSRSLGLSRAALRPVSVLPKPTLYQPSKAIKPAYAAFSTSAIARQSPAEGDAELIAKLDNELTHENESGLEDLQDQAQNVDYVLQTGNWTVKDVAGEQEVALSKSFGNEKIRVTFTVADIQNLSEQEDFDDTGLGDEMDFQGHQAANQRGGQSPVAQHPEDSVSPADREWADLAEPGFPARVNVSVEKPNGGSLLIQTLVQDGVFQIEEVSYFQNADLANAQTAEKDWARQSLYAGPPFENLDEALQANFERFLEERGINAELANMIPDYITVKEQKEYMRWLESMYSWNVRLK
ncbi:hypothetical protein N7510_000430 [Penicillium lagena]|uniref:uncharacterized protein n=1 Tax=Penicillium lagena TaxID=94218 RepID=UPI002540476C|nr:uncharacterized protein N7510_000430 [Penicillium lagena]KAJ5624121.1 hypothetical protein N7510_000430 [Penicillium lagena]